MTVGPPIARPSTLAIEGAPARATSSKKIACSTIVAPAPPYSVGQLRPAQPRSLSARCHVRRNSNSSGSESGSRPGLCSSIQTRTASRNSRSAGDSLRSMVRARYRLRGLLAPGPGGQRDAAQDQRQTGDGGDGDLLVEEDRAVEQRDARSEVADQRGAARADLCDQRVEDHEGER